MSVNGYESLVNQLQAQLVKAQMDRGAMLYCLKRAYQAQLHPRNEVSLLLLEQIHQHEPGWTP